MNEIKIPDGCKSIKIEQENDNRIVITFEPKKQEWKNGDIITSNGLVMIFKDFLENGDKFEFHFILYKNLDFEFSSWIWVENVKYYLATEQQREELFAALEKEGYRWNAEKLEIEKIEWEPKEGEECWYVAYDTCRSIFMIRFWEFDKTVEFNKLIKKTDKEAQLLCDKLNAAID